MIYKRILSIILVCIISTLGISNVFANNITVTQMSSITLEDGEDAYLSCSSDKYLFVIVGTRKTWADKVLVYDKDKLNYITVIQSKNPSTVYLRAEHMHIKGDYLYIVFTQGKSGGNPQICKYNIKEISENEELTPAKTVGIRPKGVSYIDDDVLCRCDSGYQNITFMNTDDLSEIAAIGISNENSEILKSYTDLEINNGKMYAISGSDVYIYDASYSLSGVSKQDTSVFKEKISLEANINEIKAVEDYAYVATATGTYVLNFNEENTAQKLYKIENTENTKTLEINSKYLYMSDDGKLKIFDISDRIAPTKVYEGNGYFNDIHLRPGKLYGVGDNKVAVYTVSGIEITETTTPGTTDLTSSITYKSQLNGIDNVTKICSGGGYLFAVVSSECKVKVLDEEMLSIVTEIYMEKNGKLITINDIYYDSGYLYVSYDGWLRKYSIEDIKNNKALKHEGVIPLYSDLTKDSANHIAYNENYICVAMSDSTKSLLANGKIAVYDAKTREYITSITFDSANANYDLPIRNMWIFDNYLYVSWNNAKTSSTYEGALVGIYNGTRYSAPLCRYNLSGILKDSVIAPEFIAKEGSAQNGVLGYNRGSVSYLDSENKTIYQGNYSGKTSETIALSYNIYDISSDDIVKKYELTDGSVDCVCVYVKDGYLIEILQNNGGLSVNGVTSQPYNKILIYDIENISGDKISLLDRLVASYTTSLYGEKTINDVIYYNDKIYLATTSGVEVLDASQIDIANNENKEILCLTNRIVSDEVVNCIKIFGDRIVLGINSGIKVLKNNLLIAEYSTKKPVYDLEIDAENKTIFITQGLNSGYGELLSYTSNDEIEYTTSLILEDINCFKSIDGDKYIFALTGNSSDAIDRIQVYDKNTGTRKSDITVSSLSESGVVAYNEYFCTYKNNLLSLYKANSGTVDLSSILVSTYTTNTNITDVIIENDLILAATENGLVVLRIVEDEENAVIENVTTLLEENAITALQKSGNYIYFTTESGKILVYSYLDLKECAASEVENQVNIIDITVDNEKLFCLDDEGNVSYYETGEELLVSYDVEIKEPVSKSIGDINNQKGFPYAEFDEKIFSTHSQIAINDDYIATGGNGSIDVYFIKSNCHIKTISCGNVKDMFFVGNVLYAAEKNDTYKVKSYDLSCDDEMVSAELIELTGNGNICVDKNGIWVYDQTEFTVSLYGFDGKEKACMTGCDTASNEIYIKDDFLYFVNNKIVKLYNVSEMISGMNLTCEQAYCASLEVPLLVSAICVIDDYAYIATNQGNITSNRLYVFEISASKNGENTSPEIAYRYSTIISNGGGKIGDMVNCGDFLVLDAYDAKEIQIVNIKNRLNPYLESCVSKSSDTTSFSELVCNNNKICGISKTAGLNIYDFKTVDISKLELITNSEKTQTYAEVGIVNESNDVFEGKLILAMYQGKLFADMKICDISVASGTETYINTPAFESVSGNDVRFKAMIWDNFEAISPLSEHTVSVELSDETGVTFYVDSVNGSENAQGTENDPFKSIKQAQQAVRNINKMMSGDITVVLSGGRYELDETIVFTENDGGFNGHKVIYKAKDGEKPIISGGKEITGWELYDAEKNIYSAPSLDISTRQLIVNGEPAIRAKSKGGLTNAECDDGVLGIYCYDDFIAEYKNIKDLELVFLGDFLSKRIGVDAAYKLDSNGRTLLALNRPFWQSTTSFATYILPSYYENAYELLDEENEFYLDTKANTIYYKPKTDVDMSNAIVIAPVLEELVKFEGGGYYKKLKNIEFSGITFSDSTWLRPTNDGGYYPQQSGLYGVDKASIYEAALSIKNTDGFSFNNCVIENIGGNAVRIIEGTSNVEFIGNRINNSSGGGICIGEVNLRDANPWDERRKLKNITIENNFISDIAREYYSSCAIAVGSVQNISIAHNEISNTPYTAIHLGWGWDSSVKRNLTGLSVEYNYIHDVMQILGDGGAIYNTGQTLADLSVSPNRICNNHIGRVDGTIIFAGAAIYLDTGSSGYLIESNVIDLRESNSAWVPKWATGNCTNNTFTGNFSTTSNSSVTDDNLMVSTEAQWSEDAYRIVEQAGLESAFKHLKNN